VTPAETWTSELAAWAIPERIMAQAPESPWAFTPALFQARTDPGPDTPSRRTAREALPEGGSVLDVGCGGGAAGLALVPPAGRVTGFDPGEDLLAMFSTRAREMGVDHQAVHGRWPEDAAGVDPADIVVCHHVAYNVPDMAGFVAELVAHARVRAVMELTGRHPKAGLNHLWRHFWDVDRPTGPTADDAIALLGEAGFAPRVERMPATDQTVARDVRVASVRRYLCLPAERDPEIDALLDDVPTSSSGDVVTLWWDGTA